MPVLFSHAGFSIFGGGFVGVDVFVISGFLICGILTMMQTDKFSLQASIIGAQEEFYRRSRCHRGYICIRLVVDGLVQFQEFSSSALASVTFLSNIYFEHTSNYFARTAKSYRYCIFGAYRLKNNSIFHANFAFDFLTIWNSGYSHIYIYFHSC